MFSTNLGFSVTSANGIRPNHGIPLPAYIHIVFENTHTHIATAASETEGVAAVSSMESHMIRRPLGSIEPNSIRETELHTESRRRQTAGRGSPYTGRSVTGRGMLLVRGLPLRVGGRPMRHEQKGACVIACV